MNDWIGGFEGYLEATRESEDAREDDFDIDREFDHYYEQYGDDPLFDGFGFDG